MYHNTMATHLRMMSYIYVTLYLATFDYQQYKIHFRVILLNEIAICSTAGP